MKGYPQWLIHTITYKSRDPHAGGSGSV